MSDELATVAEALPGYEITGEIGRGGMGVVLGARHRRLGRRVAIKQLPPGLAADAEIQARFLAEGQRLATLSNPHVVPVYDFVEHDDHCYLVMEELTGGSVWQRFRDFGCTREGACAVTMATLVGLHHAHGHRILHRDIKPDNLLLSDVGHLKVSDFGIAEVLSGEDTLATSAGVVLGTPAYMAPEQALGAELTPATDVYATAVVLYELLAGRLPFSEEGDALAILCRHAYEDPTPLADVTKDLSARLTNAVMKGLAREPAERYASAEDFAVAIGEAATEAWGPGWLSISGVPLMAHGRVLRSAEVGSSPAAASDGAAPAPATATGDLQTTEPRTDLPGSDGRPTVQGRGEAVVLPPNRATPASADPRETVIVGSGDASASPEAPTPSPDAPTTSPDATDPAAGVPAEEEAPPFEQPAHPLMPSAPVKPVIAEHVQGALLASVDPDELVPVRDLTAPSPRPLALAAVGLFAAALLVALIGVGLPRHAGDLERGQVRVNGVAITSDEPVPYDPAGLVAVKVDPATGADGGASPTSVELQLSQLGVPLGSSGRQALEARPDGSLGTLLDLSGSRYLVPGTVTGTLTVWSADLRTARQEFAMESTANGLLTVPAGLVALALLVFLALGEAILRPVLRGRRRPAAPFQLAFTGAVLAMLTALAGWVLGLGQPTRAAMIIAGALGAAAGFLAARAAKRAGRRRLSKRNKAAAR